MSAKTILITGATGSLGAYLTRYYSRLGNKVIAHGRDQEAPNELLKYAEYVSFDLTKDFNLPDCDICIHAAALSDDKAKLSDLLPANEIGTKNLLEKLSPNAIYVHISSSSVYLPQDDLISEELAGKQNNRMLSPYGFSKLKSEESVHKFARNEQVFILRPRAFYGAGDRVILPRILKVVKNDRIERPGKMDVSVSLTHYSTVAHAIDCCIKSNKTGVSTYNVADDEVYKLIDILTLITTNLYGKELPEKEIPIALMKVLSWFKIGGVTPLLVRSFTNDMVLDTSSIKNDLGFNPPLTFYKQLDELITWVKNNGGVEVIKTGDRYLSWTNDL